MRAIATASLQIEVDGRPIDAKLERSLAAVLIRQTLNAPALSELVFAEPPKEALGALQIETTVRLATNTNATLFDGEIVGLVHERDSAGAHVVRVRGYDRLHRLRKRQRARAIAGTSASDLAREAAREIDVAFPGGPDAPTREIVVQHDQSDFELLAALAGEAGLYLSLDDAGLHLLSLAGDGAPLTLRLGRALMSANIATSADSVRRGASANAWNVSATAVLTERASNARQSTGNIDAFASLGERGFFNRVAASAGDVAAIAQSDLDHAAARANVLEAVAKGDPQLRPGRIVDVEAMDGEILGQFTVTSALHRFDPDNGYVTELSSAPPERAAQARTPVFTMGIVLDLADPQSWSRVRVKLPLFGDVETLWMPVLIAGAGPNKGCAIMPEVGDRVLVLFPDGNPASGIVLGGLYGEETSPGFVASGTRPFAMRTGNGQSFVLDAEKGLVRVETSGGDHLELGPDGARLHATQDLVFEAPGKTITIRARAIEFEQK